MDEVDTFDHIVPPTRVIFIDISTDVGTQISLEFQIFLRFHDTRI